jgi:hypothetical protein
MNDLRNGPSRLVGQTQAFHLLKYDEPLWKTGVLEELSLKPLHTIDYTWHSFHSFIEELA